MRTRNGRKYPYRSSHQKFKDFKKTPKAKIHAIYEQQMFEIDAPALLVDVNTRVAAQHPGDDEITSGHEAATALIHMMHRSFERLSPRDIIDADDPDLGPKARATRLWENTAIRRATVASLSDSVHLLAKLWATAWEAGGGDGLADSSIKKFTEARLSAICRTEHETFVPSLSLDEMAASGDFEPPA